VDPAWFWIGLGVTGVLGAVTIGSAVDTIGKHGDYVDAQERDASEEELDAAEEDGRTAQNRTNVVLGITAGAAVATAVTGAFLVDWSPSAGGARRRGTGFAVGPGRLAWHGRF
jgi:hypothetical protein